MKAVYTIILVFLAVVAVLLFVFIGLDTPSTELNQSQGVEDNVSHETTPPSFPQIGEEQHPEEVVDLSVDCGNDYSCFLENLSSCKQDVFYKQEEKIVYSVTETVNDFTIRYATLGFNENEECLVSLTLDSLRYSYTDKRKQEFLANNYTEQGFLEIEDSLNISSQNFLSKSGICKVDVSSVSLYPTGLAFLDSLMQNYEKCSGDLFSSSEEAPDVMFFIYVK